MARPVFELHYTPLVHADESRLLILHAGALWSPIKCSLAHIRLDGKVQYDALSYVWGTQENWRNVMVNDKTCSVGWNLFEALQYLRRTDKDTHLWVDALCINQSDDSERGHQVAQMSKIYSGAYCVRAWLGHKTSCAIKAFKSMAQLHRDEYVPNFGAELLHVCSRTYWSRLWIIQEVVLARNILIHCAEFELSWDAFSSTVLHNPDAIDDLRDSNAARLCRQRRSHVTKPVAAHHQQASLLTLLSMYSDAECADVRDKLYGLHGFTPDCSQEAVPVDYSCTAYELCRRVVGHEIDKHQENNRDTLRLSIALHEMMIPGALEQRQCLRQLIFQVGEPISIPIVPDDYVVGTFINTNERGQVIWTSPPFNHDWTLEDTRNGILDTILREIDMDDRNQRFNHDRDLTVKPDKLARFHFSSNSSKISESRKLLHLNRYREAILESKPQGVSTSDVLLLVEGKGRDGLLSGSQLYFAQSHINVGSHIYALTSHVLAIMDVPVIDSYDNINTPAIYGRAIPVRIKDNVHATHAMYRWCHTDRETIFRLSEVLLQTPPRRA